MDLELFSSVLRNLLHIQVFSTREDDSVWQRFQEKYCYNPELQPCFTAEELSRITGGMQENVFYGLQDDLGICVVLFLFAGCRFLAGPFVREEYQDEKIQRVLIAHRFPASFAASVQLYYSAFPVVSSNYVRASLIACIRAFSGKSEEYVYCRLRDVKAEMSAVLPLRDESLDYSSLYHRYDLENAFLRTIENGDTENVIDAMRQMTLEGMNRNRYVNAYYQDPGTALTLLRGMVRKAAERGGASLVEIHEITQRAAQRILSARTMAEQTRYSDEMILELTEAVRQAKTSLNGYSPAIRKVVEHIQHNYSQKISLPDLAEMVSLSESYLTRAFRKETGMTVFQYIAQYRCAKAAEMLRNSDSSIQEISGYVGYLDNNYFVKVFRKQYGMVPSAYRDSGGSRSL